MSLTPKPKHPIALLEAKKWGDNAYDLLKEYIRQVTLFQCEDFRHYCAGANLPMPKHLRSFAAVIVRAKNAGLITHAGYDKVDNTRAHHAMANVWRVTETRERLKAICNDE